MTLILYSIFLGHGAGDGSTPAGGGRLLVLRRQVMMR
jgi:hypothetical protein